MQRRLGWTAPGGAHAPSGRGSPVSVLWRGRRLALAGSVLVAAVTGLSCSGPEGPVGEPGPFPGSAASLVDLAEGVVGGLAARDTAVLNGFRLTMSEHNDTVWPELPASRPEVNFPVDYAWKNIELRNRRALARLFPRLSGLPLASTGVECRGATAEFESFRVHQDCWVRVEGVPGQVLEAQLFKDVLERGGGFKVFRYYEEPITVVAGAPRDRQGPNEPPMTEVAAPSPRPMPSEPST